MNRPVAAHASVRRPPFNSLIPPPPTGGDERPCWVTALERALRGSGGVYDYVTWLLTNSVPALDVVWGASSGSGSEEDAFAWSLYKGSTPRPDTSSDP